VNLNLTYNPMSILTISRAEINRILCDLLDAGILAEVYLHANEKKPTELFLKLVIIKRHLEPNAGPENTGLPDEIKATLASRLSEDIVTVYESLDDDERLTFVKLLEKSKEKLSAEIILALNEDKN
jgi:hypothetical protein